MALEEDEVDEERQAQEARLALRRCFWWEDDREGVRRRATLLSPASKTLRKPSKALVVYPFYLLSASRRYDFTFVSPRDPTIRLLEAGPDLADLRRALIVVLPIQHFILE